MNLPKKPTNQPSQKIIEEVEQYTNNDLAKMAKHYDETDDYPHEPLRFFFENNYLDLLLSTSSNDLETFLEIIRLVSKKFASLASILLTQGFYITAPLYHLGTSKQKEKYLDDLVQGKIFGGFGLSEESHGSDLSFMRTIARETEEGWTINGTKQYISNATMADVFLIVAKVKKLNGAEGVGLFIVEKSKKGLMVSEPLDKMGIRSLPVSSVTLNKVTVEKDALLGGEINGEKQVEQITNSIKLAVSMQAIGIAQESFAKGMGYMSLARKFGNRLIDNQSTQQKMADIKTNIHSSVAFVQQIIANDPQSTIEVAMAKLLTANVAVETTETIIQLTGGYGYMKDSEIERYIRDAKVTAIYGGSSDSQRKIIAQPWISGN